MLVGLDEVGLRSLHLGARAWPAPLARTRSGPASGLRESPSGTRGARGQRLQRLRGERVERSFAHLYETGGMRRTHLRGHSNILKRLLVHAGAFNLGRLLRQMVGIGTPRGACRAVPFVSCRCYWASIAP